MASAFFPLVPNLLMIEITTANVSRIRTIAPTEDHTVAMSILPKTEITPAIDQRTVDITIINLLSSFALKFLLLSDTLTILLMATTNAPIKTIIASTDDFILSGSSLSILDKAPDIINRADDIPRINPVTPDQSVPFVDLLNAPLNFFPNLLDLVLSNDCSSVF